MPAGSDSECKFNPYSNLSYNCHYYKHDLCSDDDTNNDDCYDRHCHNGKRSQLYLIVLYQSPIYCDFYRAFLQAVATASVTPFCLTVNPGTEFLGWVISGVGAGSNMPFRAIFDTGHLTLLPVMFDLDIFKSTGQLVTEDGLIIAVQGPIDDDTRVFEVDPADIAASPSNYTVLTCSAAGGTSVTCTATVPGSEDSILGTPGL
ncbi:hypothetical protein LI328DRAFT_168133 [Trichoderma asperelloides]|nr:hypothetical protein LI328DRAFT_168133 [Trichoderma asperelloides]